MDRAFFDILTRLIGEDGWPRGERPLAPARPDHTVAAIEARDALRRARIVTRLDAAGIRNVIQGDRLIYVEVPTVHDQQRANRLAIEADHLLGRHEDAAVADCEMCPAMLDEQPRDHPVPCRYSNPARPHTTMSTDAICDSCRRANVHRFGGA